MSSLVSSRDASQSAPEPVLRVSARRRSGAIVFGLLCAVSFLLVVVPLADILWTVLSRGAQALNLEVFTQVTNGISGGLLNAIEGTLVMSAGALLFAAPVGVITGVYLAEFGKGAWGSVVRFLADVLTGVPSIVLGYFSYVTLVEGLGWQFSALAGAITLAILIVPYIARFTELAMRQNPSSLREAGYALGGREHQVVFRVLLPAARSGVITGVLLSLAISVGETAPLIYTAGYSNYMWDGKLFGSPVGYLTGAIWTLYNDQTTPGAIQLAYAAAFLVTILVLAINVIARMILRGNQIQRA